MFSVSGKMYLWEKPEPENAHYFQLSYNNSDQ